MRQSVGKCLQDLVVNLIIYQSYIRFNLDFEGRYQ